MEIVFKITDIPKGEQEKYPTAYLEGILQIFFQHILFFNQPGILLVELAIVMNRWLINAKGKNVDFNYESMDYDKPILSIKYVEGNDYRIYSIWQEVEMLQTLTKDEIEKMFNAYISNLDDNLKTKTGIELQEILIKS